MSWTLFISAFILITVTCYIFFKKQHGSHTRGIGEGTFKGTHYSYEYYPGNQNNGSYFKISIPSHSSGSFILGKENSIDRILKHVGIFNELETGDPSFDHRFHPSSNHKDWARLIFDKPDSRHIVNQIFDIGFQEMTHNSKELTILKRPCQLREKLDLDLVENLVELLIQLQEKIPGYQVRKSPVDHV